MFGEYASRWYAAQDLAASTMQNYRRHIEEHLLPTFESSAFDAITGAAVTDWERKEIAAGYRHSSVKTWRGTLHLMLADAVEEGLRESNPAARRRGRGRRDRRARGRGPEKAVTTALGALLIAERAALLSGRDDEFVALVLATFTGIRWGELVGLEPECVRPNGIRVEWQLYELDSGELLRCPPKDGSYRTIDVPDWLSALLSDHIARSRPRPCSCHGRAYVYRGFAAANGAVRQLGAKVTDVARRAGVSTGTVSAVLNRPDSVPDGTRAKVEAAITELGYIWNSSRGELAPHWRPGWIRHLVVPPGRVWLVPKQSPAAGAAGANCRRPVARHSGAGARRGRPR